LNNDTNGIEKHEKIKTTIWNTDKFKLAIRNILPILKLIGYYNRELQNFVKVLESTDELLESMCLKFQLPIIKMILDLEIEFD